MNKSEFILNFGNKIIGVLQKKNDIFQIYFQSYKKSINQSFIMGKKVQKEEFSNYLNSLKKKKKLSEAF